MTHRLVSRALRLAGLCALTAAWAACGSSDSGNKNAAGAAGQTSGGGSAGVGGGGQPAQSSGVTVTPAEARATYGAKVQFSARVTGAADQAVSWSVEEAEAGTIDESGLYTAPERTGSFRIVATSNSDDKLTGSAKVVVSAPSGTPPKLEPGIWSDLTPPEANLRCCIGVADGNTYGAQFVELDPADPRTIYLGIDQLGLWKTTDGGSTWQGLGSKAEQNMNGGTETKYLDSPIRLRVDPDDSNHLYATQGVRGATLGFWVSNDGGETWTMPQGFADIASSTATRDVTMMAVDPSDFDHVLLASHSAWQDIGNAGILESTDGGQTWIAHQPEPAWNVGTIGISFLYSPDLSVGDARTWLVGTDGQGFWRTADAGGSWVKVSDDSIPHGGHEIFYSSTGAIYAGATPYPLRSTDNGESWERLDTAPFFYYYSVWGDGTTLYTAPAYTGTNAGDPGPFYVASEADGNDWAKMEGEQKFLDGPYMMRFDSANRIMYAAAWGAGLLALKVD